MDDKYLIETCRNRVFKNDLAFGKNNPNKMNTDSNHIYRVTGFNQIYDIITSGYVRPKEGKVVGGHKNEVFWTLGGENLFYYDKRPVLEVPISNLYDNEIGAKRLDDLSAIWIFDEEKHCYINKIDVIKKCRRLVEAGKDIISKEEINLLFGNIESSEIKTR